MFSADHFNLNANFAFFKNCDKLILGKTCLFHQRASSVPKCQKTLLLNVYHFGKLTQVGPDEGKYKIIQRVIELTFDYLMDFVD